MEEPNPVVRWIIYLFAGGDAGIASLAVIAFVAFLALFPRIIKPSRTTVATILVVLSVVFVLCSSWSSPLWLRCVSLVWIAYVLLRLQRCRRTNTSTATAPAESSRAGMWRDRLCLLTWITLILWNELPFSFWPTLPDSVSPILVIGDSVTAGLNDDDDTWPRKLARQFEIEVVDVSQPGATLKSALRQNKNLGERKGIVLLEIGGNDMLEGLPVRQFETDLATLLKYVVRPDRSVIMLELPLPPFYQEYGVAQRRQAALHRVQMIPKRNFARVLTGNGSTVDGIHLSDVGQTRMLGMIGQIFSKRLKSGTGSYQNLSSYPHLH